MMKNEKPLVLDLIEVGANDVALVGGKCSSLGELFRELNAQGVRAVDGFSTTSYAYHALLETDNLRKRLIKLLKGLDVNDLDELARVGAEARRLMLETPFSKDTEEAIIASYKRLGDRIGKHNPEVAVRSSATAEDLPDPSFAGQQDTILNVKGESALIEACKVCYASLWTDRAISYRTAKGFDHFDVALSIGIQPMVRSDGACSGVMFTIDTESGFRDAVVINGAWGLGEAVVQGMATPDEWIIHKPTLKLGFRPIVMRKLGVKEVKMVFADDGTGTQVRDVVESQRNRYCLSGYEVLQLAKWACQIEDHYSKLAGKHQPMDIEWAKDGETNELFIVQARPETVQSQIKKGSYKTYRLKETGEKLAGGFAVGEAIAVGIPQVIKDVKEINSFTKGSILVTQMTDPDWVPIMKIAKGIITDQGGRTSHAAIVSRELGIPAIVGTGNGTKVLQNISEITMSCAEGDMGVIYKGVLPFVEEEINLQEIPETRTQIMLNIASPDAAFKWWRLPCKGIGLARMEFIINNIIKIHPMALVQFDTLNDRQAKKRIEELTRGYKDKVEYFIDHLSRGIAQIASSQYPHPVIVRMSDFKTNEYANLIGGKQFEPIEENPMLGFRGASRYYNPKYKDGFHLECHAIKRVREVMGLTNVLIMIPFCRTIEEADAIIKVLGENGLSRGENGLEIYVMAEIPSNVVLAEEFSKRFDGFSIGSNDLTQLVLGIDRDSSELAPLFNERNPAVKKMIESLIQTAHKEGRKVGICGQAPSDYPEFAEFLVRLGIDSISLNPDSVIATILHIAKVEKE